MRLHIPRDIFDNPKPPSLFLCQTNKDKIGELPAYDTKLVGKWNTYSELNFTIDRTYNDVITGETLIHPLFDLAEGLRKVYVDGYGYFVIQDPDENYSDNETKEISCFSSEYETANKYLENFYINTGADESAEVTYWASQFGDDYYNQDNYYKEAGITFDAYTRYFYKEYTDADSYTYTEIQITDAADYNSKQNDNAYKPLYVKSYPNVQFYNPTTPGLSLLHLAFAKIPEWSIGTVDASLWKQERKFEEDRIAVYDFLTNEMSDTFKCVVEWNTITNTVNFYEEAENGIEDDNSIQDRFDTDIFISRDNLASEINVKYSTDDIKTKLKVVGGDDLDIRDINLGQNYIMNLDYYHTVDWMGQELYNKYSAYKTLLENSQEDYQEAMQEWVGAYNLWNELMNAVPATNNVLMIGDEFTKLYCLYGRNIRASEYISNLTYYDDYACSVQSNPQPTSTTNFANHEYYVINSNSGGLTALDKKLNLHKVYEDTGKTKTDNVLLTLKDNNDNSATIRVYYDKTASAGTIDANTFKTRDFYTYNSTNEVYNKATQFNSNEQYYGVYKINSKIVYASTGVVSSTNYTLSEWVSGELTTTDELSALDSYTIKSIGTLGAYYCLLKDETYQDANDNYTVLKEYGVNLLKEKHDTYTQIFITQTEGYMSSDDAKCVASDTQPQDVVFGTKWLDTDSNPLKLYQYNGAYWVDITNNNDSLSKYEDYARYIDNYNKLRAVQQILLEKEKEATYYLNGIAVENTYINIEQYNTDQAKKARFRDVAEQYFCGLVPLTNTIVFDSSVPLYTFKIDNNANAPQYSIYLNGNVPYVVYRNSRGACQAIMDSIKKATSMDTYFTAGEWMRLSPFIREDEFSDSNIALAGYESEEERISLLNELKTNSTKELNTRCQPSLEFSMNMGNILALPEFEPIKDQFELGNYIRVGIRPGYTKRARLLEVNISFDDLSDFSATFGNLITTKSEIDIHAELMKQAIQAGKTVASSANNWQKAVDKANSIDKAIQNGLKESALEVGAAGGQAIRWDEHGILGRKLIDGTTDQYEDTQFRILNNKICFTSDNWNTSKAVFGEFQYDSDGDGTAENHFGVLAEAVVGGYVKGSKIEGGSLKIGTGNTYFQVSEDGSVAIMSNGQTAYADASVVTEIKNSRQFHTELVYSGSTIFTQPNQTTTITCKVYSWDEDVTNTIKNTATFRWIRTSNDTASDTTWNSGSHTYTGINTITIGNSDVASNAQFYCQVTFDETQLS